MLMGQEKEVDLPLGFVDDVLDHLGHRAAGVGGAENDAAINKDAVGIGLALRGSVIRKQSPRPCRYILIFARDLVAGGL